MNYTKLPKKALLLLATPVMLSLAVPASKLVAQSQTETKIRLMAEALRARDSGDLTTAKTNLEQLLVLAPNDVTVQRLLSGVNDSIARGGGAAESSAPAVTPGSQLPVVVYDPNRPAPAAASAPSDVEASVDAAVGEEIAAPSPEAVSAELARAEEARVRGLLANVRAERRAASRQAKDGDFDGANARLAAAAASLPVNTLTQQTLDEIADQQTALLLERSQYLLSQGDTKGAKEALDAYISATSPEGRAARRQAARIDRAELNPSLQPIEKLNPEFIAEQKDLARLSAQGRSQYAAGAIDEAQVTFRTIETLSADNAEAKYFLKRIADDKARQGTLNREKTRSQMLEEVAAGWQRPGVFIENPRPPVPPDINRQRQMIAKMESIVIPTVSFSGVELGRVVTTLAALAEEFDPAPTNKGVNLVLSAPLGGNPPPPVNITLRNLSLRRILDIITENVGYQYVVDADLVQIRPSGDNVNLATEQFPITKATLTRMTGLGASSAPSAAASADPFAPAPAASAGGTSGSEADAIRRFFQAAGIPFDNVPGSALAYDGTGIIVTQTGRNIDKIRNVLARYNDIRQVEIEAKFMDVSEGALDEFGISWTGNTTDATGNVAGLYNFTTANSGLRSLNGAFTRSSSGGQGSIVRPGEPTIPIVNSAPALPGSVDFGADVTSDLVSFTGVIGDVSIEARLRAISRRQGTDLLSAPKVTVLSGSRATITVAQELRYPQSYGEIQSEVGTASNGGGSAGVTITAGTPQDFTTRNVGVELGVTPTVEEDDYSISLELNPRVTEFEGFVEFGGSSVAIAGGGGLGGSNVVTVPSGFFQPIFSTREINTRVTVWDGATLVMGGLTREEVRRVNDKVPLLGDIPFIGRAFRSKGESSQKRNLLVFVTANLVSPGGSLKKQNLKGVSPSSLFQNPTVVTPGGSESRSRSTTEN
jgi:general secretion pathway protein D